MSENKQLPLGDDDPAHLLGTNHPVIEDSNKDKYPGVTMELERIGALYNELVSVLADAKLSKAQDDFVALENRLGKIANLSLHALRTVTGIRAARDKAKKS